MKLIYFILFFFLFQPDLHAQNFGIGTSGFTPVSDALLELRSSNSGFLLSRLTSVEKNNISNPSQALLIYQTDETKGFKYFDGSVWRNFGVGPPPHDNFGNHSATENIQLKNFWISNDGDDEGVFIASTGNIGIGTSNPIEKIEVIGGARITGLSGGSTRMVVADANGKLSAQDLPLSPVLTLESVTTSSDFTISSSGFVTVDSMVLNLTEAGTYILHFTAAVSADEIGVRSEFAFYNGGTIIDGSSRQTSHGNAAPLTVTGMSIVTITGAVTISVKAQQSYEHVSTPTDKDGVFTIKSRTFTATRIR